MKRDMDLIRHLLLEIENKDDGDFTRIEIDEQGWSHAQIVEHLFQLCEQSLIAGRDASHIGGREFIPTRLTSSGHDFLDSIRNPEIWAKTKAGADAVGGFTVELLGDLAKGFIRTKMKQHTGIDF